MSTIEDELLVKRAAAGKQDAFEQLLTRYQSQIYRLCFRMAGNADDAQDLAQESFIKAWRNLPGFRYDCAFSTWLYRLTSNVCLDFLRAKKRRQVISLTVESEDGEEALLDVPDVQPLPEEQVLTCDERSRLSRAMSLLEPQQRQLLTLRVVNDLSYAEIASALEIKEGTVKSRLSRAREALRKKYEKIGNESTAPASNKQKGGRNNAV